MRYCNNCGNPIENERFCTKCGADNGEVQIINTANQSNNVSSVQMPKIEMSTILHWLTIGLFAIVALVNLAACLNSRFLATAHSMLFQGGIILSILYFVIGMWGVIPALSLILNGRNKGNKGAIGAAIVSLIIVIVLLILKLITKDIDGIMGANVIVFSAYTNKAANIIIFSVLTVVSGIIAMRKEN